MFIIKYLKVSAGIAIFGFLLAVTIPKGDNMGAMWIFYTGIGMLFPGSLIVCLFYTIYHEGKLVSENPDNRDYWNDPIFEHFSFSLNGIIYSTTDADLILRKQIDEYPGYGKGDRSMVNVIIQKFATLYRTKDGDTFTIFHVRDFTSDTHQKTAETNGYRFHGADDSALDQIYNLYGMEGLNLVTS